MTSSSAPLTVEEWRRFEERFGIRVRRDTAAARSAGSPRSPASSGGSARSAGRTPITACRRRRRRAGCCAGEIGAVELGGLRDNDYRYLADDGSITVDSHGRIKTGDLGFLDGEGYLHLTGRAKDLIIRGGVNISPVEIDAMLMQRPEVIEAATMGVPDRSMARRLSPMSCCGRARPRRRRNVAPLRGRAAGVQGAEADRAERRTAENRARQARPQGAGGAMEPHSPLDHCCLASKHTPFAPAEAAAASSWPRARSPLSRDEAGDLHPRTTLRRSRPHLAAMRRASRIIAT